MQVALKSYVSHHPVSDVAQHRRRSLWCLCFDNTDLFRFPPFHILTEGAQLIRVRLPNLTSRHWSVYVDRGQRPAVSYRVWFEICVQTLTLTNFTAGWEITQRAERVSAWR